MGVDYGFDMVPPLSNHERDSSKWQEFLTAVEDLFQGDESMESKENIIEFNVGEHPRIPFDGHKLLSFSSKVSGRSTAKPYITNMIKLAKACFGQQVRPWHEGSDRRGFYDWNQEAIKNVAARLNTRVFAQNAYEIRLCLEWDDSPETQKMKSFMETLSAHMSFGFSDRWGTPKDDALRTLDAEDFEKWL